MLRVADPHFIGDAACEFNIRGTTMRIWTRHRDPCLNEYLSPKVRFQGGTIPDLE